MKPLTDGMKQSLRHLYIDYKYHDPFLPKAGQGSRSDRYTRWLLKRGLVMPVFEITTRDLYKITKRGIEYVEQSGEIEPLSYKDYLASVTSHNIDKAYQAFQKYADAPNLRELASSWQERAQALFIESVSAWDEGGLIDDREKHEMAEVYRWLAIIAKEELEAKETA